MNEILNIEQLRQMACSIIDIPGFDDTGTIRVKVQKPKVMAMAAQGKIPNYLMSTAMRIAGVPSKEKPRDPDLSDVAKTMELYCRACLVQPTYEEFQDIITDDQMTAIFEWAIGDTKKMSTFRPNQENGSSDNNGPGVPEATK